MKSCTRIERRMRILEKRLFARINSPSGKRALGSIEWAFDVGLKVVIELAIRVKGGKCIP